MKDTIHKMETSSERFYYIIFFCVGTILFFSPAFVPPSIPYYLYYAIIAFSVFIIIIKNRSTANTFNLPVILLLISVIIAGISATNSWNQSLFGTVKSHIRYLSYILFFLLIIFKFKIPEIEKMIIVLGIIYIIIYAATFIAYPVVLFGNASKYGTERGFQRIVSGGQGFLFLFSFFSLGRLLKKPKITWLIIYLITVVCIVITLTRTLIVTSFVFSVLYILIKTSNIKKILAIMVLISSLFLISRSNIFNILLKQTQSETADVKNNVRLLSATYYLNYFSPDTFSRIFGNGVPDYDSSYGSFCRYMEEKFGYYVSDIGYLGLYVQFGLIAVLAYVMLIYKTIKIKVSEEYLYCKYFLYYIFAVSVIIDSSFDPGCAPSIIFALYILSSDSLSFSAVKE
jgi:hypothetical protein